MFVATYVWHHSSGGSYRAPTARRDKLLRRAMNIWLPGNLGKSLAQNFPLEPSELLQQVLILKAQDEEIKRGPISTKKAARLKIDGLV